MNLTRKQCIQNNEISELYTFSLGGYSQKVLIEGRNKNLPLLITLHGGPGTPIPFSVGCRGLFPTFTDQFIMVYWDQLGCGINHYKIDSHFSIDHFVNMTLDLIDKVKNMFPNNPLYIFATSWGSILSAKVALQRNNLIDGIVVCGQIIKEVFFNPEVYYALDYSNLSKRKLADIYHINIEEVTSKQLGMIASSLRKYTDAYLNKIGPKAPMSRIIWGLLTSPDYKFKDFKAIMINGYRGNVTLWREILKLDLSRTLAQVNVPYLMLQGDTDIIASTTKVKELVEYAKNPYLSCQIIDNTGHMPGKKMMDCVFQTLCALKNQSIGEDKNE